MTNAISYSFTFMEISVDPGGGGSRRSDPIGRRLSNGVSKMAAPFPR